MNVADLRNLTLICGDPDDTQNAVVFSEGKVDPETGKVSWNTPERESDRGPPEPELLWPPEHDILEAAMAFGKPFNSIRLGPETLGPETISRRPTYNFYMSGIYDYGQVDAISLKTIPRRNQHG